MAHLVPLFAMDDEEDGAEGGREGERREAPAGMINGPFRDHFHNVIARESVASAPSRWREIGHGWVYPKPEQVPVGMINAESDTLSLNWRWAD